MPKSTNRPSASASQPLTPSTLAHQLDGAWAGWPLPIWSHPKDKAQLHQGDVLTKLREMPSKSVQCVVTSPPYWGLRDYDTHSFIGGDSNCPHKHIPDVLSNIKAPYNGPTSLLKGTNTQAVAGKTWTVNGKCTKCGAKRMDKQLGSEDVADCRLAISSRCGNCFVCHMVQVFREVKRVLRDDGALWLNLGDAYDNGDLAGTPWRVALALQDDGWILRQDIIWAKLGPMPESVENRCTKSHEYIFLLTKGNDYYYDNIATAEPTEDKESKEGHRERNQQKFALNGGKKAATRSGFANIEDGRIYTTRNKRSVWSMSTASFSGMHFAVFPTQLVENCMLAGTSAHGACADCGKGYVRVVNQTKIFRERPNDYTKRTGEEGTGNSCPNSVDGVSTETVGWCKDCSCSTDLVIPCVVMDPFVGSGTVAVACIERGRRCVGIDLSESYLLECAIPRIEQAAVISSDPTQAIRPIDWTPPRSTRPLRLR